MKYRILYSAALIFTVLSGCVSEFNAVLPPQESNLLVVDGNIIGDTLAVFSLSRTYSMDEWVETGNVWATLTVIDSNGGESQPALNTGNGKYQINIGKLDENLSYGLRIEYNGDVYFSELSKPLFTPEIDSVTVKQLEQAGDVHLYVSTHDKKDGAKYYIWNYAEDWEIRSFYYAGIMLDPQTGNFESLGSDNPFYYCWKNNRINKTLLATSESFSENKITNQELVSLHPREGDRFSVLYSILVSQQAISKSAYEYYLNKRKINEDMGGLFTPQPSQIYGNITCQTDPGKRAIGYVEVIKNASRKRIFVQGSSISKPPVYSGCELISADSIKQLMKDFPANQNGYVILYGWGLRPVTQGMTLPLMPDEWSTVGCVDCTVHGSKNKPDFWPGNYQ